MSRFWQIAVSKLFHDLLRPLHSICLIHSSSICIPNTTREPEQFFICWCCCCHWQWQWLFLICIMLSSLKRILSRQFYSIYALDLLATHNSNIGCHSLSQSWDPRLVNLSASGKVAKRPEKAEIILWFCWWSSCFFDLAIYEVLKLLHCRNTKCGHTHHQQVIRWGQCSWSGRQGRSPPQP